MLTIVGLGNPEKKYDHTRHNFGFLVVEALRQNGAMNDWKKKKNCLIAQGAILTKTVMLVQPQTFMNNSGPALLSSLDKKIINNLLVVHDELDLLFGEMKLQYDKSAAGHNGVQSIIDAFGTKNFWRLRLGIGHNPKASDAKQFVLEKFTAEEKKQLPQIIEQAVEEIKKFIEHNNNLESQ